MRNVRPADQAVAASPTSLTTLTRRRLDTGRVGTVAAIGLSLATCLLSFLGLAPVMQYAYPLVMVAGVAVLLLRRRWYAVLSYTLLVWLVSAEVRRVVDWRTFFHEASLISITPALVSLVALPWALAARRRVHRDVLVVVVVAFVVMAGSFAIGVLRNGFGAALVDVLYLVAPAVTGLFTLTVPGDRRRLTAILRAVALWGALLIGGYAIVQFLVLPPWDAAWIIDSQVSNIGDARPGAFRAFGTLSTTGPLGQVLAVLILLLVAERRTLPQVTAFVVALTALGITLVRAGWIGLVLGAVVLVLLGRVRVWRLAAALVAMALLIVAVGGPILERVSDRASETASSGTEDRSFSVRLTFQTEIAPQTLSDPVGDGFGATGRATEISGADAVDPKFRNFDSGLFETLTRYGSVGGIVLLGALTVAVVGIVLRARRGTTMEATIAASIVALWMGLIFTDTLRAVYGVVFWTLIGLAGRVDRHGGDSGESLER